MIVFFILSCQSNREINIEEIKEKAIDNFAEIQTNLMIDRVLKNDELTEISNKFLTLLKDSAEIGLKFTEDLFDITRTKDFDKNDLLKYVKSYSLTAENAYFPSNKNFNRFEYTVPNSDLKFEVEITNIETTLKKDYFRIEKETYGIPEVKDGYLLQISRKLKNIDSESHMIPIEFFGTITSIDGATFSNSTLYGNPDRTTQFMSDITMNITNEKGQKPFEFSDGECTNNHHCMKFSPGEERTIVFNFAEPIYIDVDKIIFTAFNLRWQANENSTPRPKGLIIDINKKEVIGEYKY